MSIQKVVYCCATIRYNSFANQKLCTEYLYKTNLVNNKNAQGQTPRAILSVHRGDSPRGILTKEDVLFVFEKFLVELMKEMLKQIRLESSLQLLDLGNTQGIHIPNYVQKKTTTTIFLL